MKALALLLLLAFAEARFAAQHSVAFDPSKGPSRSLIARSPAPSGVPAFGVLSNGIESIPYQVIDGEIVCVRPSDGSTQAYQLRSVIPETRVRADRSGGAVSLTIRGQPFFTYQGEPTPLPRPDIKPVYQRGGYIHPLRSPTGLTVTDDYPSNHVHHHGVWFPWTKTIFEDRTPDFWNMGEGKGRVEFVNLGETWSGPVVAGFSARHRFVDLTANPPKVALEESWHVTAYDSPKSDYFIFDLVSTQTCASASALRLPTYHYGGLGFRGHGTWNGTNKCFFLTANGETNRLVGNETRGRWCHIGGEVDGRRTGLAILCHPENFRSPQPMRLHPSEPFFCFAPSQLGEWAIVPGQPYVSRYRFVVLDGPPNRQLLDALWEDYAQPRSVRVSTR